MRNSWFARNKYLWNKWFALSKRWCQDGALGHILQQIHITDLLLHKGFILVHRRVTHDRVVLPIYAIYKTLNWKKKYHPQIITVFAYFFNSFSTLLERAGLCLTSVYASDLTKNHKGRIDLVLDHIWPPNLDYPQLCIRLSSTCMWMTAAKQHIFSCTVEQ